MTNILGGSCSNPLLGTCQQNCTNVHPGSGYYCSCRHGYKLSESNSHYCEDIDECAIFGKCSQKCDNFKGGFKCSCYEGYQMSYSNGNMICKLKGKHCSIIALCSKIK